MDNKDIGALWLRKAKSGANFMGGNIEILGIRYEIVLFKNKYKDKPNQPDWKIFPSKPVEQQVEQAGSALIADAVTDPTEIPF
jgi:uncharacterized protein (DUF736 family)